MKKKTIAILIAILLVFAFVIPASAITDGELDGDGHPHVVLLLMEDAAGDMWRCSGTMLAPKVVLTAGHCTNAYPYPEYTAMRIFIESDVENGDNNYPYKSRQTSIEAKAWYAHPDYETAPFFYHDVGVVILKKSFDTGGIYGELPKLNQLDKLKINKKDITFTSVGYGMQKSFPTAAEWKDQAYKIRMVAYPKLIQINTPGFTGDYSLLLSNNANTGGTCFGDSGGPNFLGDTNIVAGVTSFGMNNTCGGTGGVFRMDRQDVLDFVQPFLE
jgi:hypothetical protein